MQQFQGHELVEATNRKSEPNAADAIGAELVTPQRSAGLPGRLPVNPYRTSS